MFSSSVRKGVVQKNVAAWPYEGHTPVKPGLDLVFIVTCCLSLNVYVVGA